MTNEEMEVREDAIKFKEKLEKLLSTDLWKEVIEKGYFEAEGLRLVDAYGNPSLTVEQKENVKNMIVAIPSLKNFIGGSLAAGNQAQMDIDTYHEGDEGVN